MNNKDIINDSSRTAQIDEEQTKIDYLKEYELIIEAFPDENPEKSNKLKSLLQNISDIPEFSQLKNEIQGKIQVLDALVATNKEVDELISQSAKEKEMENYHYSTYNRFRKYDDETEDDDQETNPRLSKRFIDKLLCSDIKQYYRTHELNEILYLHFKGFKKIENLTTFINMKVLYLEGNSIQKISGLDTLVNLTSLYLHENVIDKIEGLDTLVNLYSLNLSDNCISVIENLGKLPQLNTLLLKRNRIGIHGLSDVKGLLELHEGFTVLDISNNQIDEAEIVNDILAQLKSLRVLYMSGNECVRKISNYRKTLIALLEEMRYIDDKPVFEDERRFAMAFSRGGYEEEKKDRALYRKEIEEKELKRINDFREMMNQWKKEGDEAKSNGKMIEEEDEEEKERKRKEMMTPEEREKQKLELLARCKNKKKNEIFTDNEMERFPEIKKEREDNHHKERVIEKEKDNDAMPELEVVSKDDSKIIEQSKVIEIEDKKIETPSTTNTSNATTTTTNPSVEVKKEPYVDKAVKIQIKELDELD